MTFEADEEQTSWFVCELRAAELSVLRSTDDHQYWYLCFHSPVTNTHTHMYTHIHKQTHRHTINAISNCFRNLFSTTNPRGSGPDHLSCCHGGPGDAVSVCRQRNEPQNQGPRVCALGFSHCL